MSSFNSFSIYAPVLIPTLNRYEHVKRCLESLERCTGAEFTDVYIGLDYPPSEKYLEGWKKVDAYLAEKERCHGFKSLIVRRRDHNCGVVGVGSNGYLLRKEFVSEVEYYIYSEDDNEFSPNFLEFMNKALEHYKDDGRVIRVSGYTPVLFSNLTEETTFFGIDTPAYGLGYWVEKKAKLNYMEIGKELTISFKRLLKLYKTYPALIYMAAHMVKSKKNYGDIRYSMSNLLYGTFTLQPTQSLVRNWGTDGSGVHSGVVKGLDKEKIQTDTHFNLNEIPYEYPKQLLKRLHYRNMPSNIFKYSVYWVYKFLYVMWFYWTERIKSWHF